MQRRPMDATCTSNPYVWFNGLPVPVPLPAAPSSPDYLSFNFVNLNPNVLNCMITGPNAAPCIEVTTGGSRTVFRMLNSPAGLAWIDWGTPPRVEITKSVDAQYIGHWLRPADHDPTCRIMVVKGKQFMWLDNRNNCRTLYSPGSEVALARIFRGTNGVTLDLATEAFQLGILEAAIVATVVFQSGRV